MNQLIDQHAPRIDVWLWAAALAAPVALRVIHYDVERTFGTLPAPLLTFPIGYPLAIVALSLTGLSVNSGPR